MQDGLVTGMARQGQTFGVQDGLVTGVIKQGQSARRFSHWYDKTGTDRPSAR